MNMDVDLYFYFIWGNPLLSENMNAINEELS